MRGLLPLFVLAACGAGSHEVGDAGADLAAVADLSPPPDFAIPWRPPSDHPMPVQVTNHGGATLAHIAVWTVVWKGDEALGVRVDRFHRWMLASDYWSSSLAEYGVGAGTANGVLVLPDAAPPTIDYSAFDGIIDGLRKDHPSDENTHFAFVVPPTTHVTLMPGWTDCVDFGGYHSETRSGATYSVNLQCDGQFDTLTMVLSHEEAETATDAHPLTQLPGWYSDAFYPSEVGDLCTGLDLQLTDDSDGGGETYTVERVFSEKRAAGGTDDPCVPAPSTPYFGAAIDPLVVTITTDVTGAGSAPALVEPFAYGAVGAIDWVIYSSVAGITLTPSKGHSMPGQTIPITVHASSAAQPGSNMVVVLAKDGAGTRNQWFFGVSVQ
jgi:hypothetical protein